MSQKADLLLLVLALFTVAALANETKCQREARVASEGWLLGARVPSCEEDGTYSPQQCHGSTGHCWCTSPDGTEIENTRTGPGEDTIDCSGTECECSKTCGLFGTPCCTDCTDEELGYKKRGPECACSVTCGLFGTLCCTDCTDEELGYKKRETKCQREARVASEGWLLGARVPSCEKDGTYSPQQCHGSTGHCWCTSPDGTEIENTRTGPGEDTIDCSGTECECSMTCGLFGTPCCTDCTDEELGYTKRQNGRGTVR